MILNKVNQMRKFDPQAVGRESGVPISLSNFLQDVLQQRSFKMASTSNSLHLPYLRHRKKGPLRFSKLHYSRIHYLSKTTANSIRLIVTDNACTHNSHTQNSHTYQKV